MQAKLIRQTPAKPLVLTPTGTPTFAEMARSRPSSECVPDEPVLEECEIQDVIVEDVIDEDDEPVLEVCETEACFVEDKACCAEDPAWDS